MNSTGKIRKITNISLSVAILTVCSWISVPIGNIPFSMQTFAIVLILMVLGMRPALYSVLIYILLGLTGLPVYAGFSGGISTFFTPAGGFLIGFVPMILLSGFIIGKSRIINILAAEAGTLCCYASGVAYTCMIFTRRGQMTEISAIIMVYVVPYFLVDLIKNIIAVIVGERLRLILARID